MSAVAKSNHLLASIDAVYASDSGLACDALSAAQSAVAVLAPAVRDNRAALEQLDRLETLLHAWMSANDAWTRRDEEILAEKGVAGSRATACGRINLFPRDQPTTTASSADGRPPAALLGSVVSEPAQCVHSLPSSGTRLARLSA